MRKIIILDVEPLISGSFVAEAAFWFQTPTSSRLRGGPSSSAVPNVTKQELSDIQAGKIIETVVRTGEHSAGAIGGVLGVLVQMYDAQQIAFAQTLSGNNMIGQEYDGASWSTGTGDFAATETHKAPARIDDPDAAILTALSDISQKLDVLIELESSK